jgi:hypothetical protein
VLIVHFSITRLAGAPVRLVQALQRHTPHEARLVDLERWGQFDHDVVFAEQPELALELAERADVLHLHNYLDLESQDFAPIDFGALARRGKLVLRQFHSSPDTVAARLGGDLRRVLDSQLPALVVGHNAERYYPRARVVPNLVPQDDPLYRPSNVPGSGVFFGPSERAGAWEHRWNTKGLPEVSAVLGRVQRRTGCAVRVVTGRPLSEVMDAKRQALVVVDDVVTGSYHLAGLEGLSVGRPVLAFLDARTERVLRELSGAEVPFLSVTLERAEEALVSLVSDPDRAEALGRDARAWVERHWRDRDLVAHYVEAYERPETIARQPALAIDELRDVTLPDRDWEARRRRALAARPLHVRAADSTRRGYHRLPWPVRRSVRRLLGLPVE